MWWTGLDDLGPGFFYKDAIMRKTSLRCASPPLGDWPGGKIVLRKCWVMLWRLVLLTPRGVWFVVLVAGLVLLWLVPACFFSRLEFWARY